MALPTAALPHLIETNHPNVLPSNTCSQRTEFPQRLRFILHRPSILPLSLHLNSNRTRKLHDSQFRCHSFQEMPMMKMIVYIGTTGIPREDFQRFGTSLQINGKMLTVRWKLYSIQMIHQLSILLMTQ